MNSLMAGTSVEENGEFFDGRYECGGEKESVITDRPCGGGSVMVWSGITINSKTEIITVEVTLNAV